jgi:predicted anti-sigma-YlaC factor YlaD
MNCIEVKLKISAMFDNNFTPQNVDLTRAEIDPHLLQCGSCREFLKEMYKRKREEFERAK